jgi:hypothetical protein
LFLFVHAPFAELALSQERTNLEDTESLLLLETLDVLGLVSNHVETDGLGKRPARGKKTKE